jgi:hypothetical protein
VVVMNADGSAGVEAAVSVGAKVPFLLWLGIGLLIGGAILLAVGGLIVYRSSRSRTAPESSRPTLADGTSS